MDLTIHLQSTRLMIRVQTSPNAKGGKTMELYTLASAAEIVGCTPSRLKGWMEKGYIPDKRIQFGKVRARVLEETALPLIQKVLSGIEKEGLTVHGAFTRYFNEEEVNRD
jgi:hypothetical protein